MQVVEITTQNHEIRYVVIDGEGHLVELMIPLAIDHTTRIIDRVIKKTRS